MASGMFLVMVYLLSLTVKWAEGSLGDRNNHYRTCLMRCSQTNCPSSAFLLVNDLPEESWAYKQPWYMKAFMWECEDECKYQCMWETVDTFVANNYSVPQFYGKWPFVRLFGIQEPASTIFSVLNGIAHFYMLQKFLRAVPKEAPTFHLWRTYAMLSINAWFWSAVFHTRDFPFTEKMDYFCALAAVLFSFYAFLVRLIGHDKHWKWTVAAALLLSFYTYHCYYLTFVHFDYGYNMLANVSVGVLNSIGWLLFCSVRREGRHWRELMPCAVSVLLVDCLMVLELLDFPPFLWTFDAHSLWHLGTAPIPFIWYRFLIEDSIHLHRQGRKTGKFL